MRGELIVNLPADDCRLWKNGITYDGLLNSYRITFGPGIRSRLNESYRETKATFGITTSLPFRE